MALPSTQSAGSHIRASILSKFFTFLGRGVVDTVYRARDHELKRDVAIKALREDLSLESPPLWNDSSAKHGLHLT